MILNFFQLLARFDINTTTIIFFVDFESFLLQKIFHKSICMNLQLLHFAVIQIIKIYF